MEPSRSERQSTATAAPPGAALPRAIRSGVWAILAVWVAVVAVPPVGLALMRERLLTWQSSAAAQQQWTQFREAMQEESTGTGPVKRKVPKSLEPPLKVWLRDYFSLAIAAWVLFGSVLFFVIVTLARGAVQRPER
jgi:hypothetical protein